MAASARVMRKFAPPHVVVTQGGDVVHISEGAGKLLQLAAGAPSHRLESLAPPGLRHDLRSALRETAETGRTVTRGRIKLAEVEGSPDIALTVEPLASDAADTPAGSLVPEPLFLVVFNTVPPSQVPPAALADSSPDEAARIDAAQQGRAQQLLEELTDLRQHMDATVEAYESSIEDLKQANEELASMNEEHQAANEELETSQEELQSINEELISVNSELAANVEALAKANEDMANLFDSSAIATVFLDGALRIRRFTPAMAGIFNLVSTDIDRKLSDITCQLDYASLHADIDRVHSNAQEIERLVSTLDGSRKYLARALPFHTAAGKVEGIILNFVDVTTISPSEERLRTLLQELNHRIRNLMAVVIVHARRSFSDIPKARARMQAFTGRMHALSLSYGLLSNSQWRPVEIHELFQLMLANYLKPESLQARLDGPTVWVDADRLLALCLILHELMTNAEKYGALSLPRGHVDVIWSATGPPAAVVLRLRWAERDGPPVTAPEQFGMGTGMIRSEVCYRLGGEVDFSYPPTGFVLDIKLPLKRVDSEDDAAA
jgi:two-component system, chemotaxis family, CheB/CheR fusion protein